MKFEKENRKKYPTQSQEGKGRKRDDSNGWKRINENKKLE